MTVAGLGRTSVRMGHIIRGLHQHNVAMELGLAVERVCHRGHRNLMIGLQALAVFITVYGVAAAVYGLAGAAAGFAAAGVVFALFGLATFIVIRWGKERLFVELEPEARQLRVSGPLTGKRVIDLSQPGVRLDDGFVSRNHAPRLHTPGGVVVLMALARSYDSLNFGPDPAVGNMISRIRLEISNAEVD